MIRRVTLLILLLFGAQLCAAGALRCRGAESPKKGSARAAVAQLCAAVAPPRRSRTDSRRKNSPRGRRGRAEPKEDASSNDSAGEEQPAADADICAGMVGACAAGACSVYHS